MPKDRGDRSSSFDRLRLSTFLSSSSCSICSDEKTIKEWEHTLCPVCMEHPHNAVLLICSSHEKGCHPFMCDTSYRHSNCFDQFLKSFTETSNGLSDSILPFPTATTELEAVASDLGNELRAEGFESSINLLPGNDSVKSTIICPLCRGMINGWTVMESARHFMSEKSRSCASETCNFSGTYNDLRKHARLVHPLVRPTVADPERQRKWRRLERQRDLGDLISTLESSIGEEVPRERAFAIDEGGWLAVFLVRSLRPQNSRSLPQVGLRRRRPSRRLWGETIDGMLDSRDGEVESINSEHAPILRLYARRRIGNELNVNRESAETEVETLGSDDDQMPISTLLERRFLGSRDNSVGESQDFEVESFETGNEPAPVSGLYARRYLGNGNNAVHESGDIGNGSSSDGG